MNTPSRHRIFYLVPVSREAGLTSVTLGLVRALQLAGVRVGYVKPIVQPEVRSGDLDLAAHFARTLCGASTPDPIPFDHAAEMVRSGQLGGLMEEVVSMVETVQPDCDIVIVEGLIPDVDFQIATRLNIEIIRSLGADLIPVLAGGTLDADGLAEKAAAAAEQYGDDGRRPIAGVLINRCADAAAATALTEVGALTLNGAVDAGSDSRRRAECRTSSGAASDRHRRRARAEDPQSRRHRNVARAGAAGCCALAGKAARPSAAGNAW